MKKVLFSAIVIIFCFATTIMASHHSMDSFTSILPACGGDVDCIVRAKGIEDASNSRVKIDSTSDSTNFWLIRQEGGIKLTDTIYIKSTNANIWVGLAYSKGTVAAGQNVLLRADGANPNSGITSGYFDVK